MSALLNRVRAVPGFSWWGANAGIKDDSLDFGVIVLDAGGGQVRAVRARFPTRRLPLVPKFHGPRTSVRCG